MSSVTEHFRYKNQEKTYSNNIRSLHSSKSIPKKANIFELMAQVKLEKKTKNKSSLKFFGISAALASSVVLFYSLY